MAADLTIVVPTRDSAGRMPALLGSIEPEEYGRVEVIVNDDPRSVDDLDAAVVQYRERGLDVRVLHTNTRRAAGRIDGVAVSTGRILLHLDSDMACTPGLIAEIVDRIDGGLDAMIVPEASFGTGFWSNCKVLEKACVEGDSEVECLRAMRAELYREAGGHDPELIWSEDKDLDIRIRALGAKVGRTERHLQHDEGEIHYFDSLKKKAAYALTAQRFAAKHPDAFRGQSSPVRVVRLLRQAVRLSPKRSLVGGLVLLKSGEYAAVAVSLIRLRLGRGHRNELVRRTG